MTHRRTLKILCLSLLLPMLAMAAEPGLRQSLFGQADLLLAQARELQADLLAPRSFNTALQAYQDAEGRFGRGQSLERIRDDVELATSKLNDAIGQARTVTPLLANSLRARAAARTSDADTLAPTEFSEADEALSKVAADLERGRTRKVQSLDEEIAGDYRRAELAAIKHRMLADTRQLFDQAEALRAERFAPATMAQAQQLLAEADRALSEDRYDADRPRSLAREANYQVSHAIYLTRKFSEVRRDKLSLEALLLEWESGYEQIGDAADLVARFDQGPAPVARAIVDYLRGLQSDNSELMASLSDRDQQIAQMELEIRDLEQRLGGVARERSVLEDELTRQARARERFSQIEAMFTQEEAAVIRESGKVTLRLIGLSFPVGEADIGADNFPLLAKVQSAIRVFPRARLVVDGHTDSFGSDQKNMALSLARAEAVRQYLLVNLRLDPGQITAVGHGEAQPIANNETREGRARNRRIELVLFPEN